MTNQATSCEPFYSSLASDPDLGEIVEMFVDEMPDRIEALVTNYQSQDWGELRRLAHQLKGAAGSYGFDQLTPFSARLESELDTKSSEQEITDAYESLVSACKRLKPGSPE